MKYVRLQDIADLIAGWHPVNITNAARQYDIHMFLEDYESVGNYTVQMTEDVWWFEKEEDAMFLKLKFGQ